ncbi:MAG: FKBP-type peptidyl-prolyl cis-trans isomerase [Bacteroidales bacterium]|nr:FKBP-type peptidyl-prolyl cis-trans isomerase [Bacteroidales bacterium]
MKSRNILALALSLAVLASCGKKDEENGFVKTASGYEFKHCVENKNAPKAKEGDILLGELEIRLNDSVVLSSNYGSPDRLFKIGKPVAGSMDEFLLNMHIGDSAVMKAPADSVAQYIGGLIAKPGDVIWFYLSIHQIISQRELSEHEREVKERFAVEDSVLSDFVARKYPNAKKMESGLYVINATKTEGVKAEFGKTVSVFYSVSDTTGKMYDTNMKSAAKKGGIFNPNQRYDAFEFVLGDDGLIAGWTEGVSYMRKGEKSLVLLPSYLAYGEAGYGPITPYMPLLFELELVDVK